MKRDEFLERLSAIEVARADHERQSMQLLMERDRLIYEALVDTPKTASAAEIADVLNVGREWPYRIRDAYPERLRRWQASQHA